jgi:outer membrane receptor protein involved in Fe transport
LEATVKKIAPHSATLTAALAILLSLGLLVPNAFSQLGNSSISGTVTDPSGAAVVGAKVVVTNVKTGVATSVATNSAGRYTAPQLGVGDYQVEVQKDGFQSAIRKGISVAVEANVVADFALSVGSVSEHVEVNASAPIVDTTDSAVGTVINEQQIQDLPLNGRDLTQLALLTPGVQEASNVSLNIGWGFGSPLRYSTAGLRAQGQAVLLDGTNIQGFWDQGPGLTIAGTSLGVDSVAEFKVLTNTYDAQYGGYGAATVEVTRSGTNDLHGSAYLFARNSVMDARNYFDPTSGPPPFHRYQFGASIGGPIKKDKTFFFANYEGLRQVLGLSSIFPVPDQNARNGYLPCSAAPDVTCDTTTGLANVGVNPATAGILNTYPPPNGPNLGGGVAENLQSLSEPTSENYAMIRFDHNFSNSDSIFARYLLDYGNLTTPNPVPTQSTNDTGHNQYFTLTERKIISPTLVNSAMFGFTRTYNNLTGGTSPGLQVFSGRPSMWLFVGGLGIFAGDPFRQGENRFTFSDDVLWTHGKHNIKFGASVTRTQANSLFPLFLGGFTQITSVENLLRNNVFLFIGPTVGHADPQRNLRDFRFGPYIQDDWQITPRLTLNLGLRYEFMSNPVETHNKLYALINPLSDAGFTHVPNVFQTNPAGKNFGPRIGFAWDPFGTQKTSIRGGFGMFYNLYPEEVLLDSYSFDPPYYDMSTVLFTAFPDPFASSALNLLPSPTETTSYKTNKTPYAMEYNLNIQRQLSPSTMLTVGYVGSQGRHAMVTYGLNGCNAQILSDGTQYRDPTKPCIRQNPAFSLIDMHFSDGNSNYNSLQVSVVRRVSRGLQFTSNYTWSKNMDFGSGFTGVDQVPGNAEFSMDNIANAYHRVDYAPSAFDIRHNWNTSVIYDLPFKRNRLVSGWQIGIIGVVHSGHPFVVVDGFDQCNDGGGVQGQCRPDYATPAINPNVGSVNEWFNPAAYVLQPAGTVGNVGRNSLVGPGFVNFDASLSKDTHLGERSVLNLRFDVFNIANHADFNVPNSSLFAGPGIQDPTAGHIFSTVAPSRQIQLSARFAF